MLAGARIRLQRGKMAAGQAGRQPALQTASPLYSLPTASDPTAASLPPPSAQPVSSEPLHRRVCLADIQYKVIFVKLFRRKIR